MAVNLLRRVTAGAPAFDEDENLTRIEDWSGDTDNRLDTLEGDDTIGGIDTIYTEQVANFGLILDMQGTTIPCNKASELDVTIPANADQAFDVGARIRLVQTGAGSVKPVAAVGVTLDYTGDKFGQTRQKWGALSLLQIAANHWIVTGDLAYSFQDIAAAGAIDLYADHVRITGPASSTYAVTLAAPTIGGRTKVIEMVATTGTNSVTLALTNCVGGTAATTATFTVAGHTLILVSHSTKWVVVKQQGVVLT